MDGGPDATVADAMPDAPDSCVEETRERIESRLALDLLFVVDNSGSMSEEQLALSREVPRMIDSLVTGDVDSDGRRDVPAVRDLHLGVVVSDMGTGAVNIGCGSAPYGEDGVLRDRTPVPPEPPCRERYPRFLEFRSGDDRDRFITDFNCVGVVGDNGCGAEMHLEAMLKALTPSTSPLRFRDGTVGHGDGVNAGFLREESILAVIVVADEDDCSASDTELFREGSETYTAPFDHRCSRYEDEALYPVSRYVDGLRALRAHAPERLFYVAIAGIPQDLVSDPEAIAYETVLADERMQFRPHPEHPSFLANACEIPDVREAFAGRRLVRVAQGLGGQALVQSICQESYADSMAALLRQLGTRIRRVTCDGVIIEEDG
jgi:hypothetical protein